MTRRFATFVVLTMGMRGQRRKGEQDTLSDFYPVVYPPGQALGSSGHLDVFPAHGKMFTVDVPFPINNLTYSPDGTAVYATAAFNPLEPQNYSPGLVEIRFGPVRATLVPGSTIFGVSGIGICDGQRKIFISGVRGEGRNQERGIFELDPLSGQSRLRVVNESPSMPVLSDWSSLSVSPDGRKISARRDKALEVIDLPSGDVRVVAPHLEWAAWSPDGKWLAAVHSKEGRTVLMDALTLSTQRTFGTWGVAWSPDSRYLLGYKQKVLPALLCGPYSGTFQVVEVANGGSAVVSSSRCKAKGSPGWLRADMFR